MPDAIDAIEGVFYSSRSTMIDQYLYSFTESLTSVVHQMKIIRGDSPSTIRILEGGQAPNFKL